MAERRVYSSEFRQRLGGWSESWFLLQRKRHVIPVGNLDAGSRRPYWLDSVVTAVVEGATQPSAQRDRDPGVRVTATDSR